NASVSQLTHQRGVTILALRIADGLHENIPDIHFDRDVIIAGGLVHDIGKTYEYDPERAIRWRPQPQQVGYPHCCIARKIIEGCNGEKRNCVPIPHRPSRPSYLSMFAVNDLEEPLR
ncbi:MAG TPA: HD domain-containing protein, partial [Ktedonobacteraceae bacterium]